MARGNFGERLKRERELREVTLQEITSATRIGPRFLEALENEDWEKLPGGVFNRGFVRSIARYLGLDEEALLGEYDLAHGAQIPPGNGQPEQGLASRSRRWQPFIIFVVAILLFAATAVGGFYAWRHYVRTKNVKQTEAPAAAPAIAQPPLTIRPAAEKIPVSASAPMPLTPQPAPPTPQNSGPMDLRVSTSGATHVLVLADGHVAFYDEMHGGENRQFRASQEFEVTASDSGAVLLELNGVAMPPLGVPGSSGTIKLNHDDLRQAQGGNSQR